MLNRRFEQYRPWCAAAAAVLVSQATDFSIVDIDSSIKHDPPHAAIKFLIDFSVLDHCEASAGVPSCGPCGENSGVAQRYNTIYANPAFQKDRGVFFGICFSIT